MLRFFFRQSATLAFTEALAVLFAITWLDLATGHQVSLVLFYTAPIVVAVWLCDNKSVFVIAGLAGVLWSWADLVLGHSYSNGTVQAWEIAVRFAFFFLVGLAGIAMREQQRASNARIALLEHTQRLEKQIIEVSEYEQQRIGRDLHDGLCQFFAAHPIAAKNWQSPSCRSRPLRRCSYSLPSMMCFSSLCVCSSTEMCACETRFFSR